MGQGSGFGERELLHMPHLPRLPAELPLPHIPLPHPVMPDGPTVPGGSQLGANGLGGKNHGPTLSNVWNSFFSGAAGNIGDGRPNLHNHIGRADGNAITGEGSLMSRAMRSMPYLGDYWEALAVTHDSRHIQNPVMNAVTALTEVGLPGPLMGLMDAPFRMAGSSMFLNK